MPDIRALDLITTPIAVLNGAGLTTKAGLSADDPLAVRHAGETFRVFVSFYDPAGAFHDRAEFPLLVPNERRLLDIGAEVRSRFDDANSLAVVHRVPLSVCPEGTDPATSYAGGASHADFAMYRCLAQYGINGGSHGGVIYETPPGLNSTARGPSNALTFTSKIAVSATLDTTLMLINHSVSDDHDRSASFRFRLYDAAGNMVGEHETAVAPGTVSMTSIVELVGAERCRALCADGSGTGLLSLVGWCSDVALLALCLQIDRTHGTVTIEHAHPPQTYLLASDPASSWRIKGGAISVWNSLFESPA